MENRQSGQAELTYEALLRAEMPQDRSWLNEMYGTESLTIREAARNAYKAFQNVEWGEFGQEVWVGLNNFLHSVSEGWSGMSPARKRRTLFIVGSMVLTACTQGAWASESQAPTQPRITLTPTEVSTATATATSKVTRTPTEVSTSTATATEAVSTDTPTPEAPPDTGPFSLGNGVLLRDGKPVTDLQRNQPVKADAFSREEFGIVAYDDGVPVCLLDPDTKKVQPVRNGAVNIKDTLYAWSAELGAWIRFEGLYAHEVVVKDGLVTQIEGDFRRAVAVWDLRTGEKHISDTFEFTNPNTGETDIYPLGMYKHEDKWHLWLQHADAWVAIPEVSEETLDTLTEEAVEAWMSGEMTFSDEERFTYKGKPAPFGFLTGNNLFVQAQGVLLGHVVKDGVPLAVVGFEDSQGDRVYTAFRTPEAIVDRDSFRIQDIRESEGGGMGHETVLQFHGDSVESVFAWMIGQPTRIYIWVGTDSRIPKSMAERMKTGLPAGRQVAEFLQKISYSSVKNTRANQFINPDLKNLDPTTMPLDGELVFIQ